MTDIEFVDEPPTAKRGKDESREIAAALRANPGQWAIIAHDVIVGGRPSQIKNGVTIAYRPAGSFEARSKGTGNGRGTIYARYVGENGEHR